MIETSNTVELLQFLIGDLTKDGSWVTSPHAETQNLIDSQHNEPGSSNDETVVLDFSPQEFASTLQELGRGAEFMWPGTTTESAGLRLLLTHIDEQRQTDGLGHGPKRLTLRNSEPLLSAM